MASSPEAPPGRQLGRGRRAWRRLGPDDRFGVGVLTVVPLLAFGVPAMTGHPAISWDNLLQNFPLRVLSGQLIRHGHLPLWNPTIWSGSPLLAGLNAGSFYPATLLFAVLPALLAWVLNLVAVYWAAGLGMYALLRQFRLRPLACLLAALTYQWGGAMTGQLVHIGIIQGMGWMPLLVLAELRLSWAVLGTGPAGAGGLARRASPWPWVTLMAVVLGLIFLTGEPRSMAEAELVVPILLIWWAARGYPGTAVELRARFAYVAAGVGAAAWGAVIGAAQLLPGRSFILASQRAAETYAFFGTGSLHPAWTVMLLVQNVVGGNAILGQPSYSASYNLPEVTGYVGLLPLAAFCVLVVRGVGRRSDPRARDWRPWLVLAPLGLLLAWGDYTPLGHVFAQIPFYNKVRLDSRSLGIVDLALAVLFGFWLELFLAGEWRDSVARRGRWLREVVVPLVAPAAGLVAALVEVIFPITVVVFFGGVAHDPDGTRIWIGAQAAVACGALAVVWSWRRSSAPVARRLLVTVVVADLGLFVLANSTGMYAGGVVEPSRAQSAALVGTTGRFAIIGAPYIPPIAVLSEPDVNALTGLDSVQGYGSIVGGTYDAVTGTHFQARMDPCALARGVFVPLRLSTLFIQWPDLVTGVAPSARPAPAPACSGAPPAGTTSTRTFYLGQSFDISSVHLQMSSRGSSAPRVGLLLASGRATDFPGQQARPDGTGWEVTFDRPASGIGLVVDGRARAVAETSEFTTERGDAYELNGLYQQALGQTSWRYDGTAVGYARFKTDRLGPTVSVRGAPGASVRRLSETAWGTETDLVSAPAPVTVVRSEAYLAGWHVVAQPASGGPSRTLTVFASGLLQAVSVPAGRWRITFSYWPSGLTLGGVASAVAVVAASAVPLLLWRRRRRSRLAGAPDR